MKIRRKILAVLVAVCMTLSLSATAFAVDTTTPVAGEDVSRISVGKWLAGRSNDFYGDGTIDVYLDSGNSWADIQAGTGPSSCTGYVSITVKFPDGELYYLGTIDASADHTAYKEFTYCPSGLYTFYFENTTNDWIQVYANIYD